MKLIVNNQPTEEQRIERLKEFLISAKKQNFSISLVGLCERFNLSLALVIELVDKYYDND